jgi:hypothetical protein
VRYSATILSVALACAVCPRPALAGRHITLGPSDGMALDQPRVAVEVVGKAPDGTDRSYGPEFSNTFLLDTGASGVMAAGMSVTEMTGLGYQTVATYDEQGVAGTSPVEISAPYQVDFAGSDGLRNSLYNVRLMSSATLNLGGFDGIVGMPAMLNRNTTLDMSGWSDQSSMFIEVGFSQDPPPDVGHRYPIPLDLRSFPLTGQRDPADPLPTSAPLPHVPVQVQFQGQKVEGKFILDTGAQMSMLSSATAFALGMDRDGNGSFAEEAVDWLEVGGIGGSVEIPLMETDAFALHTQAGVDLVWNNMTVGIVDIDPSIAGVFGMELLTSGWFEKMFLGTGPDGYISKINFDFRDAANFKGTMLLDINPDLDQVVFTPDAGDADQDGDVDIFDVAVLQTHYGTTGGAVWGDGDYNGDGNVDIFDVALLQPNYGLGVVQSAAPVPEPASLTLGIAGLAVLAAVGWSRRRRFSRRG